MRRNVRAHALGSCSSTIGRKLSVRITVREHALWSCSSSKISLPFLPLKIRAHNYTLKCKLFVNADSFGNFRGSICQYFEALSCIKIRAETNTPSTRLPGSSKYPNYPIAGIRIRLSTIFFYVFFLLSLSLSEVCFLTNESKANEFDRRSFATHELKSRSWSWRRTARAADELGGVRVIDRDRQRLGINVVHKVVYIAVRVVEAMWRSVAIRARLSKRKGKEQFSSSRVVVCRSFWPSFMKSYTVDGQHNAVNLSLWSRVTPWAS